LTQVVKKRRDERQQKEAALRAEQHAAEVREKALEQRRRSQILVTGMAAALVVMGGFLALGYYQFRVSQERLREALRQRARAEKGEEDARRARIEALKEKERAESNEKLADKGFEEARSTVDELLTEMSQQGLQDVPGLQDLRQRFAKKAVTHYVIYRARRPDDLAVTHGHARSLNALGTVMGVVGSANQAVATLEQAVAILDGLVSKQPSNAEFRFRRAKVRSNLGEFYWSTNQPDKARPLLQQSLKELEKLLSRGPAKLEHSLALVDTLNTLGNVTRDGLKNAESRRYHERGLALAQKLYEEHPNDMECLQSLIPLIGNLAELTRYDADYVKALELTNKALALLESARKPLPHSPNLLLNRAMGYEDKADLLARLERPDEAARSYQEAMKSYRSAAQENPLVNRYQWKLADAIRRQAARQSARNQYAEAKALYEESCEILGTLTERVDDLPMYGAALIESWERLADFYKGTKGDTSDLVAQQRGRLRCLDQAVQAGRKLSKKFPDDTGLHHQLAEVLFQRALYDSGAGRNKEAFPFYQECVEVFRSRVRRADHKPTAYELRRFLTWLEYAQSCATELRRSDETIRFAQVAYDLGKESQDREAVSSLGNLVSQSAKVHKDAGRYPDAILTYSRAVEIRRPAFEKAPWDWHLRSGLSADYKALAECYEKTRDYAGEVRAWREYLRIWSGPMHGMKIAAFIDSARPLDAREATRLREFASSTPATKRYNYSYELDGVKYPLSVYITNVPWPQDPLADQARSVPELNGGTIPVEVREFFRRLHKIAYENNYSFVDFCERVISASSRPDSEQQDSKKAKARLSAQIAALTQQSSAEPTLDTTLALAKGYDELAAAHKGLAELKEAIEAYERSVQLYLRMLQRSPNDLDLLKNAARIEYDVGDLYDNVNVKEYGKAYVAYQRSLDFWEHLLGRENAETAARAGTTRAMRALGLLCKIAFTPTESAHWYEKAMEQDDPDAAAELATVYLEHPEVAATLSEETRRLLTRVARDTHNDPRAARSLFTREVAARRQRKRDEKLAELGDLAAHFHQVAAGHQASGHRADYRMALRRKFDVHAERVSLQPSDARWKHDQAGVAAELARSYLEASEADAAVEWTTRAADLGDVESLLRLADWYEKGTYAKVDARKANHYRYLAHYKRGTQLFGDRRYADALPDLERVCTLPEVTADDHNRLAMCYGKLGRWDDAIKSYISGVDIALKSGGAATVILNLLEAFTCAERPEQLLEFVQTLEKKGWKRPTEGPAADSENALYHGFRAIALKLTGRDPSEAERMMRELTGKPSFEITDWTWDELNGWLKATKLAPDRKAFAERIIAELQGTRTRQ
jgi:tetratricopeptide (TPR) repeat protein